MPKNKQLQPDDDPPADKKSNKKKAVGMEQIENQIKKYVESYQEQKSIDQSNVDIVSSMVEEYLQTFVLIGYNYDGELITHAVSKSQVHSDALNTGLHRFIMQGSGRTTPPTL